MNKKLIMACLALIAVAAMAVVPALASASPVLTNGSTAVATGTKIIAKNTGIVKFTTNLGPLECSTARMTGTLTVNSGTVIEADFESASFTGTAASGECTAPFLGNATITPKKLPWCFKAKSTFSVDTWQLSGGNCPGGGSIEFTWDTTSFGECTYVSTGTPPITGTFTTGTEIQKTEKQGLLNKSAGGGFCPSSGEMDMTFDLYTDTGETALKIS